MRKSRFTEEQMVAMLREADRTSVVEVARKNKVTEQTIYTWPCTSSRSVAGRCSSWPTALICHVPRSSKASRPAWVSHRMNSAPRRNAIDGFGSVAGLAFTAQLLHHVRGNPPFSYPRTGRRACPTLRKRPAHGAAPAACPQGSGGSATPADQPATSWRAACR